MNIFRRLLRGASPVSPASQSTSEPGASEDQEDWEAPFKLAKRLLSLNPPLSADDYLWPERDELIQDLVSLGQRAAPAIEAALDSGLRSVNHGFAYENMGLLCEALGKVGGPRALDILAAIAIEPSNVFEFRHLREGAIRGLGHLDAPGVVSLLKRLERQMPRFQHPIVQSLRQHGVDVEPIDSSDVRWDVGASTWKELVDAFLNFELEKSRPDFTSLGTRTSLLRSEEQHGVWRQVGDELRKRRNCRWASQCYVEAMAGDSSSDFGTWRFMEIPPGPTENERLRRELEAVMNQPDNDCPPERKKRLVADLRAALGAPGDGAESSHKKES